MSLRNRLKYFAGMVAAFMVSCADESSQPFNDSGRNRFATSNDRLLYVTSGGCYGGGVTLATGSGTIAAYELDGSFSHLVIDYNESSPGDVAVGMAEYDESRLLVAVENTAGRRVDLVYKDGSGYSLYMSNGTALNAILRSLIQLADGSILISKSTAIEKFSASKSRIQQGANPFVNAPAGACAASATLISSTTTLTNGKILYTHAAASPNNRTGLISATGYATGPDCLSVQAAPVTTSLPTSVLAHSSGKILVAYGSTTASSNTIYSYNLNPTTNAWSGATIAFSDFAVVNGPSAMVEDTTDGSVYISMATSTFNTIEKFTFDANTGRLTKVGSRPFIEPGIFSRCVSSLKIMEQER